jgi:hypothetical protein
MKIKDQMKLIVATLAPWVEANAGTIKIAGDKRHLFQLLGAAPGAPRAAVYFVEELPVSERFADVAGKVARKFWLCISRGRGFSLDQGISLTEGVAGGPPMFEPCEEARELVRGIRLADQNEDFNRPVYGGVFPVEFEGVTVDAYYIEFTLAADIPEQLS